MDDLAFYLANLIAVCGWLSMLLLPRATLTVRLAESRALPLTVALVYVATLAVSYVDGHGEGHFFSLDGVASLLSDRTIALVVWIHILAFDLFVGAWIFLDARQRQTPRWLLTVCLLLTLVFGPIGYLVYRAASTRKAAA